MAEHFPTPDPVPDLERGIGAMQAGLDELRRQVAERHAASRLPNGTIIHETGESQTCSVAETAAILGVTERLIYEQARTGRIADGVPVLRVGARIRIPRARLLAYAAGDLSGRSS